MVQLKPEWRNAYMNYPELNRLLSIIKKSVKLIDQNDPNASPLSGNDHHHHHPVGISTDTRRSINANESPLMSPAINPASGGHFDEDDVFVVQRASAVQSSMSIPIAGKGTDEKSSLLASAGASYPFAHAMGTTPPLGTPPTADRSHRVFGESFRLHPMELPLPKAFRQADQPSDASSNKGESMQRLQSDDGPQTSSTFTTSYANQPPPVSKNTSPVHHLMTPPLGPADALRRLHPSTPPIAATPDFEQQQGSTEHLSSSQFVPKMSVVGVSTSKEFEDLLLKEVIKASSFAEQSYNTLADFIEENRGKWKNQKTPVGRTKDAMRFVNRELGHLIQFLETNELAVKTATKKYLHSHPFYIRDEVSDEYLLPMFERPLDRAAQLQGVIALLWAELFMDGDINAARKRIVAASASATQSFRAGFFFALIIACCLYWLHVRFELQPTADVIRDNDWMFPITRLFISMLFALVCWSWVLYVFERQKINYLYVFEFSQTASTTWMQCLEYSLMMFFLCSLFAVLYVRSALHDNDVECYKTAAGFPWLSPYIMPAFFVLFLLTVIFPIRHVFSKTRNAFGRVFWKCMQLPFGDVRFVEFFVADWGTSLVFPCGDLLYFLCFYTAEARHAFTNTPGQKCLNLQEKFNFPVAMIPYYWRACQTFKMYLRTNKIAHLINHGKYQTFIVYFLVSWAYALWPSDELNTACWVFHFAAQLYAWIWDVLMDWGWIQGRERKMMFKTYRPYIAATIVDFILRMYFVFCTLYIQPVIGKNYMYLIQAMVEIFRRSMWSIFRIENENINNLELYRKIDFVPHVAVRDELQ